MSDDTHPAAVPARWPAQARLHLARWLASDFRQIRATPQERARLAAGSGGFADSAVQDYLAWRRSMALCALLLALVAVVHAVIDAIPGEEPQHGVLTFIGWAWAASRAVLAFALYGVASRWADPRDTRRRLRWAWAIALLVPVLLMQLPLADILAPDDPELADLESQGAGGVVRLVRDVQGTLIGVMAFLMSLPGLTSLFPGAIRAGLLVKTLLPGRSMGAVLATFLAPMYALLLLVLLTFFQQLGGSGFFLLGALLLFAGPLLAMRPGWALVGPLTPEEASGPMRRYRLVSRLCTLGGLASIGIGVCTTRIFDTPIVGWSDALVGPLDLLLLAVWFLAMLGAYTVVSADALLEGMTKADALAGRAQASAQFASDSETLARLEAAVGAPAQGGR